METSEVPEDEGPATPVHQPEEPQIKPINGTKDDN